MADRAGDWLSQAVDKALKGLHLSRGQQVWGHGLGRLFRSLPDGAPADHHCCAEA